MTALEYPRRAEGRERGPEAYPELSACCPDCENLSHGWRNLFFFAIFFFPRIMIIIEGNFSIYNIPIKMGNGIAYLI